MTSDTPNTPKIFSRVFVTVLLSMNERMDLLLVCRSEVLTLSILMLNCSLGSRRTILAYISEMSPNRSNQNPESSYISRE